ncbi:MAG: HAD family phosphatase [Deltaproteobacteria bacterium]|nr:HAD family phosphatase [Deltaproteobacteria bacterium]
MLHAVLFDLDGTLVDSERETAEAMARALARGQGVTITQEDRDFIIGRSWIAIYERLAARYPLTWSRAETIAATTAARVEVFEEVGITILPGAIDAVARFANLPRALVTGSSREEAAQALRALGVTEAFAPMICAEDVTRSKPAPDGYLAAIAALGVPADHCLVIEDSTAGIAAGRAAGCAVVAVRAGNFHGQDQSQAHRVIDTLDELTAELAAEVAARARADYGAPR